MENRMMPLISVIMPVYNGALYLEEAIKSIQAQTFSDFEFIILNDGSKDNSLEIIEKYRKSDPRIIVITRENKGLIYTLNEGIKLAKGQYIARMDADDINLPERFEQQIHFLKHNPDYVAVGCLSILIDSDGDKICPFGDWITHQQIDEAHLKGHGGAIIHPSAMIRKSALEQINGYLPDYPHAEDLDLWLRLAETGKLANIENRLFLYRQHFQSIGYDKRQEQLESTEKAVQTAFIRRNLNIERCKVLPKDYKKITLKDVYTKWAWWALSGGNPSTARKYAIKVLRSYPLELNAWKILILLVVRKY